VERKRRWKQQIVINRLSLSGTDSKKCSKIIVGYLTALSCSILPGFKKDQKKLSQ